MKKLLLVIVTIFLFLCRAGGSDPRPGNSAVFQLGSDRYILNGAEYTMDAIAFIEKNRVFVPVRYLALACGLNNDEVSWNNNTGKVTLTQNGRSLTLQVGNRLLDVGGMLLETDAVPEVIGGRICLPARQVAEFFGYSVKWEATAAVLLIFPSGGISPEPLQKFDLVLVNKVHPLPKGYHPGPLAVMDDRQISQQIQGPLQTLLAEARDMGFLLSVNYGYRSAKEQDLLYRNRIKLYGRRYASTTVALPDYSEHQTGLAVDLKGSAAAFRWLEQNCWRYGFILRYPAGKQAVTGYVHEPWHYRYVGIAAATFMHDKNISTLEEYTSYIMLH